jgi:hypothetical protein
VGAGGTGAGPAERRDGGGLSKRAIYWEYFDIKVQVVGCS